MKTYGIALLMLIAVFALCWACIAACTPTCAHVNTQDIVDIEPTCVSTGVKRTVCEDCGATLANTTLDALGHDLGDTLTEQTPPTCEKGGIGIATCKRCGNTQTVKTDPLGHLESTETVVDVAATCENSGISHVKCSRCGGVAREFKTDPLKHSYGKWSVSQNPTPYAQGELIRVCANDGSHIERMPIPNLLTEEVFTQTQIIRQPSCSQEGVMVYKSAEYGSFEVKIPQNLHKYDDEREGYCSTCGQKCYSVGLSYTLSSDGKSYSVKCGSCTDSDIVIPHSYKGLPVKAIGSEGFAYRSYIKSVTVPEYVEQIDSGAFNGSGLTKVYFNAINCADFKQKNWVFMVNTEVELIVGARVTRIPARMFYPLVTQDRKVKLTSITFGENSVCREIGESAFNKTSVKQIVLPMSLQSVGSYAFYNTPITSLIAKGNLEIIGDSAFGACSVLKSAQFGGNLKTVGNDAFNYCVKLENVDLSATQTQGIGYDAFKGCEGLVSAKMPSTLGTIGKQAFYGCSSLLTLDLGGVKTIGEEAFCNCSSIEELTIPQSVTKIGNGAFCNCESITNINFNAANCEDFAAGNKIFQNAASNGVVVTFGGSVEKIPDRMFYSTSNVGKLMHITKLSLNKNVKEIGDYAFYGVTVDTLEYSGDLSKVSVGSGNESLTK